MLTLTKPQRTSIHRKWVQESQSLTYRQFRKTAQPQLFGDGAIMIKWCGMWLGIEPDGYTHS